MYAKDMIIYQTVRVIADGPEWPLTVVVELNLG